MASNQEIDKVRQRERERGEYRGGDRKDRGRRLIERDRKRLEGAR